MTDVISIEQEARHWLDPLLPKLEAEFTDVADPEDWPVFRRRLEAYFPQLFRLLQSLYGQHSDFSFYLEKTLKVAATSWLARPTELKALDAEREANPAWFQSNQLLGGVCYVDLFGGNLEGVREKISYFRELGLTYLHLMPPFRCPEGNSDGGYAVSSYREVNPALGTVDQLTELATELRHNGISLVLDFVFNHTSDEHA